MKSDEKKHGARFDLRREDPAGDGAHYRARVEIGPTSFDARAEIAPDGVVSVAWSDGVPAEWCVTALRAQLRTLFRERASRGGYPRRITRWRAGPDEEPRP